MIYNLIIRGALKFDKINKDNFKKNCNFFFVNFINRNILIDLSSNVSIKTLTKINGTKKYKTLIRGSNIFGKLTTSHGCKLDNIVCSGNIELGRFVSINGPGTRISSRLSGIKIGSFTSIASNVIIQEDYHRYDKISTYFMNRNIFKGDIDIDITTKGPIIIEEDVWIGSNTVILSGVTIGRGLIIGAGSVVTKNIPRYSIVAGNPAKKIKTRFEDQIIQQLEDSRWWEMTEVEMMNNKTQFNANINKNGQRIKFE